MLLLLGALCPLLWGRSAAPLRTPGVKGNECSVCHVSKSPLPGDHTPNASLAWQDCKGCHTEAASLTGKLSLSHVHLLSGVGCDKCHADVNKPEPVSAKVCAGCHDPERVLAATAKSEPANPHDSPHEGQNSDCNECHHQHSKSENHCEQCHSEYDFKVP